MATIPEAVARARRLHQAGDLGHAEDLYRQILEVDPANADVLSLLGMACHQRNQLDEAVEYYQRALRICPNLPTTSLKLGHALRARGDLEGAADCLRACLRQLPQFGEAHYNLGNYLATLGRPEEAVVHYRETVRLRPGLVEAHNNLANTYLTLGKVNEAVDHLRQALRLDPSSIQALLELAVHGLYSAAEPGLDRLKAWLADSRLAPDRACRLHFVLGNLLDRTGRYDEAFEHFRQGNALRRSMFQRSGTAFDAQAHTRQVDRRIAEFSPSFLRQAQGLGLETEIPVFIVGMPRSGSTLVEQILSRHPRVHGAGELPDLPRLVADLPTRLGATGDHPDYLIHAGTARIQEVAGEYRGGLVRLGGAAERVTDKLLENFLHLGEIAVLLPRARVIHCRRDARDICLSCFLQYFNGLAFAWDLEDLGHYYRDYARLMAHWRTVLPLRMLDVVYEDLVADPEAGSRRLIEFCGLEWDERCLKFHENRRPVQTASRLQVRQPLYTTSLGRWRRYEAHLGPLLAALPITPA
jgi:Flp pilus assembly protein TadD